MEPPFKRPARSIKITGFIPNSTQPFLSNAQVYEMSRTRNIGIIAHIDAGKTTVSERFLFYSGREHRMGEVHEGNTRMDWQPEEQERCITITSAATTFAWGDAQINLIDTPGHVDFTAEVERSLRVLDGAVGVFCGVAGVEAQSETVWRQADRYRVPRIAFVNKLDRVGSDYFRVIEDIESQLHCKTLPMIVPVGSEGDFVGTIDLVRMVRYGFTEETLGAEVQVLEIPEELRETAELYRQELLEKVADEDDEVMALVLEGEEVPEELLKAVIRRGTIERRWVPVLGGSAFRNRGVQPLLDAVVSYLPSPEDIGEVKGLDPKSEKELVRKLDSKEPFSGLIFKVQVDQHGELCYMRVYSGTVKKGEQVINPREGKKERLGNLFKMHSNQRESVETVQAGEIVAVTGLRFSGTGDTLCPPNQQILLERPVFPDTVISMAIEPKSSGDRDRLYEQLTRLTREDPTFQLNTDEETGQFIVAGMGELHLEVIRNRLIREFKLDANIGKPRVSYRQTFADSVTESATVETQVGGKDHHGAIELTVDRDPENPGVSLEWIDSGETPKAWLPGIEETVRSCSYSGSQLHFPFIQLKIGIRIPVFLPQTTEVGLAMAARAAFQAAEEKGGVQLLEPVMRFQITTPDEYFGSINQDLVRRRAEIEQVDTVSGQRRLIGQVPLAEVFGYTTTLRSISQGRAAMSLEPIGFSPAPAEVSDRFRF